MSKETSFKISPFSSLPTTGDENYWSIHRIEVENTSSVSSTTNLIKYFIMIAGSKKVQKYPQFLINRLLLKIVLFSL